MLELDAPYPGDVARLAAHVAAMPGVLVTRTLHDEITITVPLDRLPLTVDGIPELCPVTIDGDERTVVRPRVRLEAEPPPVGFDLPFRIEVVPGCREALSGRLSWRSDRGRALATENHGFVVSGRTPAMSLPAIAFGIVPVSADAAGEDVLHLRFCLLYTSRCV